MVLPVDDCDDCVPAYLKQGRMQAPTAIIFSSLPFVVTFLFVATVVFQKLFPLLSGQVSLKDGQYGSSLLQAPFKPQSPTSSTPSRTSTTPLKRVSAVTFATTIALAAVLAELVLCEISDTINPVARGLALRITVFLLLILLIVVIPSLELQSVISAAGYQYTGRSSGRFKLAWVFHLLGFAIWMIGFWWSGQWLLSKHHHESVDGAQHGHFIEAMVEHVGVIGISLMALLSGFASVSSPWQTIFSRPKPVSEATLARKQSGLDATNEMLATKQSRLRALRRKMSDAPSEGFLQKAIGSFRSNADLTERKTLELEISGLENMALTLSTHHSLLKSRLNTQRRLRTFTGRLLVTASYLFALYCLYRLITTSITAIRRRLLSSSIHSFTTSDPINNILALLIKHYDSHLDRETWTRQISFLLSGIMLFASFSSVLQTFHFLARFTPSLLKAVQANLPLVVAQVCGTYVISVALLLRGIMPGEVISKRLEALGGADMRWVDGWFEGWFLGGAIVTCIGIWVGRQVGGEGEEWDDDGDVEMGKRS